MLGVHRVEVDRGDRLAFARDIQMIVDRDDGRKAGIFPEQSLGPGDHVILGRHFEPDVEEAIAARLEDLRAVGAAVERADRSEEHTSELQSLMSSSYAVFCL